MAKKLDWDRVRQQRKLTKGSVSVWAEQAPSAKSKASKASRALVQRLHDHFKAGRRRAEKARRQASRQAEPLTALAQLKRTSPGRQAAAQKPSFSGGHVGSSSSKNQRPRPVAAKKAVKKKRRSVWTISGGGFETNRRRH
jgi:hypothetical protein